jgi:DNA-binding Lrp family transcriptional regulator
MRETPISHLRVAARLANGFALDLVKLGGLGRDVVDGLILAVITQANVAQITRSPDLQRRYATLDQPPPDELRRPVSINAVSASLRIPFETARRRIAKLRDDGIVQVTPKGVIVPTAPMTSPLYRLGAETNYNLVRQLYLRLRTIGMFHDLVRAPPAFDDASRPVRLVIRLSSDYLLRLAEPVIKNVGDITTGLIFMDLIHANLEQLPDDEGPEPETGVLPDERRRPARAATLAARLGMPQETVRRHLNRLLATDRCVRAPEGYVVPGRVLSRRPFVEYVLANQGNLHRLMSALGEHGVLAAWDHEAQAVLRGAA